jgi:glucose-6-phosphate-specific signal transduction histidine kinase
MGFVPRPDADRFGLTGMRRRVEGIRGTLSADTVLGKGTRIVAKAPASPARYRLWRLTYDSDGEQESTNDAQ